MLYQRYDNVTGGFNGWVSAVASHPNVNLVYNKNHAYMNGSTPYSYDRVCFALAGKYVVYERDFRGGSGASLSDPMEPYYTDRQFMVGVISGTDLDPDTTQYPDELLWFYSALEAETLQTFDVIYAANTGVLVNQPYTSDGGSDLGIVDDNHTLHAVHVFADAQNLYIIWEPEEGLFFHSYHSTDMTKHESFGFAMFGGGTYVYSHTGNARDRARNCGGYQYLGGRNTAWLYNEDLDWDIRNPAENEFKYGGPLDSNYVDTPVGPVFGMPGATTSNNDSSITPAENLYLCPGSDIVHYGPLSIYGKSLSIPFRGWYRYQTQPMQMRPLFTMNNVRSITMRGLKAKQEVVIDGQTWIAFPDVKTPTSWGGQDSSLLSNWPDYSYATPMGVLIRKG